MTVSIQSESDRPPEWLTDKHFVLDTNLSGPFPVHSEVIYLAAGCFWGVEEQLWKTPGIISTSVGYQGGTVPDPSYQQVCSGNTGHAEVVKVVYDPAIISIENLLKLFWQSHDPTQGNRQGNDVGTQYRSAVYYTTDEQARWAKETEQRYQKNLTKAGYGEITTEISPAPQFYYAENYHQQYLAKNPDGYRCHGATGIPFD